MSKTQISIISVTLFFLLISCNRLKTTSNKDCRLEKNKKEIEYAYDKMINGFKINDWQPYYNLLSNDAIVIDPNGNETHSRDSIIAHFDHQMKNLSFELLEFHNNQLLFSDNIIVGKSIYEAKIYNAKGLENTVKANWHLVWQKDTDSNWKIIREIYNFIKPD